MYILLILFFGTLLSIIIMISRKLALLKNGEAVIREEFFLEVPFLKEWRHITVQNVKKYGHLSLVATLRFYIRSTNILKDKYEEIKIKIKNRNRKNNVNSEKREISKFLKIIGDYKHKIREIKHKIKEEEKNL